MITRWILELTEYLGMVPLGAKAINGIKYALVFAGALLISLILTPLFRELARKLGMIDKPDARRINTVPIPRGGGLSIFVAFHLVLMCFVCLQYGSPISEKFSVEGQYAFFFGSLALVVVGFIDDKFGMRPHIKLIGQIAVASFLFFSGIRMNTLLFVLPGWLDYILTVFWVVGAINAFNLIDGLDGLASGITAIASIGLAGTLFFTGNSSDMIPYLALCGACLGFLRYNFHPATVFLGDTGSMFLGLCVAVLPLTSGSRVELIPSLVVPLLAMGIPIFDTLLAIWRRTVRALLHKAAEVPPSEGQGVRVMAPDSDHLHHRVLRAMKNQRSTALIFYGISVTLVAVGLLATLWRKQAPGIFLISFIIAAIVVVRHLTRIELWDTGRLLSNRRVAIRKGLIVPLYILADGVVLFLAWTLTHWVLYKSIPRELLMKEMPIQVGAIFVFLALAQTYRRVWRRAQFSDFSLLLGAVVAGVAVSAGVLEIIYDPDRSILRTSLVLVAFAAFPLIAIRLVGETFRGVMQALKRHTLMKNPRAEKILVYGAGLRFRNYMREQTIHLAASDRVIVGIIDDDLQFLGRVICGYVVLGGLSEIQLICGKTKVDRIVITCVLDAETQHALLQMAKEHHFKVTLWVNEERDLV